MKRGLIVGAAAIFGLVFMLDTDVRGGKDPVSVKVVMQKAMKGGLCGKVAKGTATPEEKKELIALFTDLAANKCPKGDEASWKEKTKAILDAAKEDDGGKALAKLTKTACAACHKEHKGK
jgi:hypothetical protein